MPNYVSFNNQRPGIGEQVEYRGDAALAMLFNEGAGSLVRNYGTLGNASDGMLQGITAGQQPWGQDGLSFDGVDDYVDCGGSFEFPYKSFSYSATFLSTAINSFALSTRSSGSAFGYDIAIGLGSVVGTVGVRVGGTNLYPVTLVYTVNPALYHTITGVVDRPNQVLFLYVDGVLRGNALVPPNAIITNTQNLCLGRRNASYLAGKIVDTYAYGYALSPAEIAELAANPYRDYYKIVPVYYSIPQQSSVAPLIMRSRGIK